MQSAGLAEPRMELVEIVYATIEVDETEAGLMATLEALERKNAFRSEHALSMCKEYCANRQHHIGLKQSYQLGLVSVGNAIRSVDPHWLLRSDVIHFFHSLEIELGKKLGAVPMSVSMAVVNDLPLEFVDRNFVSNMEAFRHSTDTERRIFQIDKHLNIDAQPGRLSDSLPRYFDWLCRIS